MSRAWNRKSASMQMGYTLLEVLVVLAIMVFLFAAIPTVGSQFLGLSQFKESGTQLYTEIRMLKQLSRMSGIPRSVTIDDLDVQKGEDKNYSLELDGQIVFFPNGAATEGQVVLRDGDRSTVIHVDGVTGTIWRTDN